MTEEEFIGLLNKPKEIVIYTGRRGKFQFHTILAIESCNTKEEMAEQYRITRDELYKLQMVVDSIKYGKMYKLLKYLKLIK